MNKISRLIFLYCCFICASVNVNAQAVAGNDTGRIKISSILISGNKRTREYIILREIHFKAGDSLSKNELAQDIIRARTQVYNTNLFSEVKVDSVAMPDSSLVVRVQVKEKWYVYPSPQFQLADRSFNEWIKTYHADFNRVVYGVKFAHYNFSGRRDQLKIYLLNGYARNIAASYSNPFVNKALTAGYGVSAGFTQNREIGIRTSFYNKILNYKRDGFVRNAFSSAASYNLRKGYFKTVSVGLGVNYINIDDSISSYYNPRYFNSNKHYQLFPDLSVSVSYLNTDNNNYPLKGKGYGLTLSKRGLGFSGGINNTTLSGTVLKYITHPHNWYSSIQLSGVVKAPFKQAYINQRAIGYGSLTLRGLEVYVVDGVAATVVKYTLRKKIAAFKLPMPFKIKAIPDLPFKIFAKTYADAGYSYLPKDFNTRLNNRLLYTGGFGLDIVLLYDIVFKLEYSFNQLGEKGLFLHGSGGF